MLEIKSLSLSYNESLLLDDINLELQAGELILLSGPSGSGKSSLLKVLNGIIPEISEAKLGGSIYLNSESILDKSIAERSSYISTVFQNPKTQFYCINSTDELAFALENRNLPKQEILDTIDKYTKLLDTDKLMDRDIFTLSGGEKQLLAVTSVACMDNKLYIFDEPSASLDRDSIDALRAALIKLKQLGKIIIVAEHRLYYLKDIIDKVAVIENKKLHIYGAEDIEKSLHNIQSRHKLRSINDIAKHDIAYKSFERIDVLSKCMDKDPSHLSESDEKSIKDKGLSEEAYVLHCDNFEVSYDKNICINTSVRFKDDVYFIIGKNGVGKSSFIKKLCSLIKGKGSSFYKGEFINKSYDYISLLMQDVNCQLFTESVWQEISIVSDDAAAKEEVLKKLSLWDKREYHPQLLSGGEKQRLLIGLAKLSPKPIVILDEPSSGLDKSQMLKIASYINEMRAEGKLIIVITHDYELINECKGRIIEFYKSN